MILKNGKRIDGMGDSMPIGSIVEYNGTDIPDGWEILPEAEEKNIYSQEEVRIGTWLGKPLYRKVIQIQPTFFGSGTPTEGATYQIAHGINDLDVSTRCDVYWKTKEGQQRKFPSIYFKDEKWGGQAFLTIGLIIFELGSSLLNAIRKADYIYLILEYTKTTD